MKKLEFICSLSDNKNFGGETIKNDYILEYLNEKKIKVKVLDFEKYKKNKILIFIKCLFSIISPFSDKILISKASKSAYKYLKLCYYFNIFNKEIYYLVIGGTFDKYLKSEFKIKYYKKIKKIYVESLKMRKNLEEMGLFQSEILLNFKKFKLKYRKKQKSNSLRAVFFSRISKEKGTDMIFKMIKKVNKIENNLNVDFYGPIEDGYEEEFFKEINRIKGLCYKGILDTKKEETFDILSLYDFMLFPTCYFNEGIPGTIIDAFISSLPIVVARWKNFDEILNSDFSFEFPMNDQEEFEKIIFFIKKNPDTLLKKREKSFEEAKKYNIDFVLKKLVKEIVLEDYREGEK